ncbi:MAG: hypothetical protein HQL73_02615 [Magnetococcales bacterium]|nr:hypothetical protein [Magnetococcales bacterium]
MDTMPDRHRRTLLTRFAWTIGMTGLGLTPVLAGCLSRKPTPDQGVVDLQGEVFFDGVAARPGMVPVPGGLITTGKSGRVTIVAGADAFLVHANSTLRLLDRPLAMNVEAAVATDANTVGGEAVGTASRSTLGFILRQGKVLSVFSPGLRTLNTPNATIGIRGTAAFLEYQPGSTYVCTCYGTAEIQSLKDSRIRETVVTKHHESPRYIKDETSAGAALEKAPMLGHTDAELIMLEELVGRRPPFIDSPSWKSENKY